LNLPASSALKGGFQLNPLNPRYGYYILPSIIMDMTSPYMATPSPKATNNSDRANDFGFSDIAPIAAAAEAATAIPAPIQLIPVASAAAIKPMPEPVLKPAVAAAAVPAASAAPESAAITVPTADMTKINTKSPNTEIIFIIRAAFLADFFLIMFFPAKNNGKNAAAKASIVINVFIDLL